MRIEDCVPGMGVVYRLGMRAEDGVVVRVNDDKTYVFVRYRGSETPMATHPEHLSPLTAPASTLVSTPSHRGSSGGDAA